MTRIALVLTSNPVPATDMRSLPVITRGRFDNEQVVEVLLQQNFTPDEIGRMRDAGVDNRMMFGSNTYLDALKFGGGLQMDGRTVLPNMPPSKPLQALTSPSLNETNNLSGEKDPSNQLRYSPDALLGKIMHKYEMVLAYISKLCSAHCRYCFRLDLFNDNTGKDLVEPLELYEYITRYNQEIERDGCRDPNTGEKRYKIGEVLLSGGDPMTLSNAKLSKYLVAVAEAGVGVIRIGTKELAFRPQRFDRAFIQTLNLFHERYPNVRVSFATHFTHPDEFLERDKDGRYIKNTHGYKWLDVVHDAVKSLTGLSFVTLENQTPIIAHVNDNSEALHLLNEELFRGGGITSKYLFQCRNIEGHEAFAVPVERVWHIYNESQKGLSSSPRCPFVMSTEWGKMEVISVVTGIPDQMLSMLPPSQRPTMENQYNGFVVFKIQRSPHSADTQGDLVIARSNPKALWISDYEDRILYDGRKAGNEKFSGFIAFLSAQRLLPNA